MKHVASETRGIATSQGLRKARDHQQLLISHKPVCHLGLGCIRHGRQLMCRDHLVSAHRRCELMSYAAHKNTPFALAESIHSGKC